MSEDKKTVKIPESLVEKLANEGKRFVKVAKAVPGVKKSGKCPIEQGWHLKPYAADDPELLEWLEHGGNYGILCGKGFFEIDIDDVKTIKQFELFVKTFTVQTGSGHGRHYYIKSDITDNGTLFGKKRKNLGNIQYHNKHVVGPGCYHHSGGQYKIIRDVPIAWVSKEELEEIFGKKLKWSGHSQKDATEQAIIEGNFLGSKIPLREIVSNFAELKQISDEEFQGTHPVHGSEGGQNFCVNIVKNCWHCFRCNSGGGPLSWLAVEGELIKCNEAQKGKLKGKLLAKTIQLARKIGYDIEIEVDGDVKKYFRGKPPRFIPPLLAKDLMLKYHYVTREKDEVIFVYNKNTGTYSPNGAAHIKRKIELILRNYLRRNRVIEVIYYIVCATIQKIEETPPHVLAVKNGLLNLKTKKLMPFSPEYFILSGSNARYDPEASSEDIEKFASEIVDKDDINTLQEISGYCLWRDYIIHKAFMLVGEGANGKSTFLELVRMLLGHENTTTIALQDFAYQRFAIGNLYGKAANIYPDLPDKALRTTGALKMLTGGDTVSAEYKFKNKFTFKNYAKMLFACNKVPETSDDTTAFFRRWVIINFPNQFLDTNPKTDKNILARLTTEESLSGFLNWALVGLERLLEQKKFSKAKSVDETREIWIRASSPVKAFAMDCLEPRPGGAIAKDDMYQLFIEYCREAKLPSVGKGVFSRKLQEYLPTVRSGRVSFSKKQVRAWVDVAIKDPEQGSQNSQDSQVFPINVSIAGKENNDININDEGPTKLTERTAERKNWLRSRVQAVGRLVQRRIRETWPDDVDCSRDWVFVVWLIQKQLDEIRDANYTGMSMLKELADIDIIITRFFLRHAIDPERAVAWRLDRRHAGNTDEIVAKYRKMWNEEQRGKRRG